jgi:hypothetical protein
MKQRGNYHAHFWRFSMLLRNVLIGLWAGGLAVSILSLPLPWTQFERFHEFTVCFWFISGFFGLLIVCAQLQYVSTSLIKGRTSDVGCWVDSLAAYTFGPGTIKRGDERYAKIAPQIASLKARLVETLKTLQYNDQHLLSFSQLRSLHRFLQETDKDLILAILEALPNFGKRASLKDIQSLIDRIGAEQGNEDVHEAARLCLERLQQRLAEGTNPYVLLRGSCAPIADTGELLHPTQGKTDAGPETLMRAATRPEEI